MAFGPLVVNATIIIVMFKFLLAMGRISAMQEGLGWAVSSTLSTTSTAK